jgi:hypothetical protein
MAHVTVGANPTPVHRTIAFALVVSNKISMFTAPFYIGLASPPPPPPAATTVPVTTVPATTVPATTVPATTVPATTVPTGAIQLTSDNWSGYGVSGGPFTGVSGTFTVPYISTAANCTDDVDTWVGIDGFNTSTFTDSSLIQAGVEASDTDPNTGDCTPGTFYAWSWWEVLPAPETEWDISVSAGDQVTVDIGQESNGDWGIQMTDDTTGQSDETEVNYDGPGETAEWIVEAAKNTEQCGDGVDPTNNAGICQLASYTDANGDEPGVTFSDLGLNGDVSDWYEATMVQYDVAVSTPSPYNTNGNGEVTGFSVSYTGDEQASLRPALQRTLPKGKFVHPIYG